MGLGFHSGVYHTLVRICDFLFTFVNSSMYSAIARCGGICLSCHRSGNNKKGVKMKKKVESGEWGGQGAHPAGMNCQKEYIWGRDRT